MKPDLSLKFAADLTTGTLRVNRTFAAPRTLVWDCHTKSELLDQWFAPKPMTTRTAHMDFRVGGRWHHAMIGEDGSEYWGIVEYREIDPIDRYATTDYFSDAEGSRNDALPSSDWEVTFSEAGDATTVRSVIQYASPEALEQVIAMGMEPGMTTTFEKLDELLLKLSA